MFYLSPENLRYYIGRSFTYNGRVYQGTVETFAALGFTQVIVDPRPNDTYYIVSGPNNDGTWNTTPRDLGELKTSFKQRSFNDTLNTLGSTNWYITWDAEGVAGYSPVPADIASYRTGVRNANLYYNVLVDNSADLATLQTVGQTTYFPAAPETPASGGVGAIVANEIFFEGTAGSADLTILGREDPANPGTFIPLSPVEASQFAVGQYLHAALTEIDGAQITSYTIGSGVITTNVTLVANLAPTAPTVDWNP